MGCFAAGHVCDPAACGRRRTSLPLGVLHALVPGVVIAALWPGLPAGLRIPVACYAPLLTATAYRSSALGALAGTGGALLLLSDTLTATGVTGPGCPRPTSGSC
ncbi:lysoplasmalogenase family protein [Streptomyces sp. NPDC101191]|uniref:lysoplasmalogenase family protein n=1 Tax=Streptomyces sp. NPDC101191 TaxID=3366126 RepID=UPI00382C7568